MRFNFCHDCKYYDRDIEGTDCKICLANEEYSPYWKFGLKQWVKNRYAVKLKK